jgi:hypothetical protein
VHRYGNPPIPSTTGTVVEVGVGGVTNYRYDSCAVRVALIRDGIVAGTTAALPLRYYRTYGTLFWGTVGTVVAL